MRLDGNAELTRRSYHGIADAWMGGGAYGRYIVPRWTAEATGGTSGVTTGIRSSPATPHLEDHSGLPPRLGCSTTRIYLREVGYEEEDGVDWDLAGARRAPERRRSAGRPRVLPPDKGGLKDPGSENRPPPGGACRPGGGLFAVVRAAQPRPSYRRTPVSSAPPGGTRRPTGGHLHCCCTLSQIPHSVVPAQAGTQRGGWAGFPLRHSGIEPVSSPSAWDYRTVEATQSTPFHPSCAPRHAIVTLRTRQRAESCIMSPTA